MPFPKTKQELEAAGYTFKHKRRCTGATCGRLVEFWENPKTKKLSPLDPMPEPDSPAVSHWGTCSDAARFRA